MDTFDQRYQYYLNAVIEFEREAATRARYLQQVITDQEKTLANVIESIVTCKR